jgi:hypothetical protein
MTDYTHLLDRLTNATGADRELDTLIWLTVTDGSYRKKWNYTHSATGRVCEMDETRDKFGHLVLVPAYSESIDAAMSLVPEGMEKEVSDLYGVARAAVGLNVEGGPFYGEHKGCSLPIALCIAAISALKARASCEASS